MTLENARKIVKDMNNLLIYDQRSYLSGCLDTIVTWVATKDWEDAIDTAFKGMTYEQEPEL